MIDRKINKVSNVFCYTSITAIITFVILNHVINIQSKSLLTIQTIISLLVIITNIICLVRDLLATEKEPGCEKRNNPFKLRIFYKISKALFSILLILSYLFYGYKHETLFEALIIFSLLFALASFILWYEYRAQMSKANNNGISL